MNLHDSTVYLEDLRAVASNTVNIHELRGKTVLVTGATGTIGSFIVDALLQYNRDQQAGIRILATSRNKKNLETCFNSKEEDGLVCLEYDIMKPVSFNEPVDYIIHTAGNAFPAAFNKDPVGTILGNVGGTYALLEYGRTHGVQRFLYVSSGEVYGQGDASLESFDEEYSGYLDITAPRSCYPCSKRTAETLCVSYARQYGVEVIIVRPCHTYGPGITMQDNRAHVQFMRNALKNEDIVLKSAGNQMRSYCYAGDCASAILSVLLCGENGKAYNIAHPESRVTIAELAQIIAENVGRRVVYEVPDEMEMKDRTPIAKQVLSSKQLERLGWNGLYDIKSGIQHTLSILKDSNR